jgi:RNA polymerase sigma-B factor
MGDGFYDTAAVDEKNTSVRRQRADRTTHLIEKLSRTRRRHERERLRDEIVLLNDPIAVSIASRYRDRGADFDDLVQVARLGLVGAVERYDREYGSHFLDFAVPTIRGEVRRYFRDHCWAIRPTRRIQELQLAVRACEPHLTQALGRSPRVSELAEELGVPEEDLNETLACEGFFHLVPLDAPVGPESTGHTVADGVGERDRLLSWVEDHYSLRPLLEQLSERDKLLLRLRFEQGRTQAEIGEALGVSQMQVSRLLRRLYQRLRRRLVQSPRTAGAE